MISTDTAIKSIIFTLIVVIAVGTFTLKNQVQVLEKELNSINSSIKNDVQAIHILKAEWSHLNTPQRLRSLAAKYIDLNPARAEQIINYSELPFMHSESDRRILAQKSVTRQAERNKELKRLVNAQR